MGGTSLNMQSTRQQILEYLQRHGRGTVKELGELLGLTSTGIRQHLTVLERDDLVEAHEERGRVGRPTLVYSLTNKADGLFPKTYDLLASVLLAEIRSGQGNNQLHKMLHQVAKRLATPYEDRVRDKDLAERVKETAAILEEQGCMADWSQDDSGDFFIDEYTCPFPKIAQHDRSVCALHVEFVGILTGADAKLSRSLMRGERACTYRLRPTSVRKEDLVAVAN